MLLLQFVVWQCDYFVFNEQHNQNNNTFNEDSAINKNKQIFKKQILGSCAFFYLLTDGKWWRLLSAGNNKLKERRDADVNGYLIYIP